MRQRTIDEQIQDIASDIYNGYGHDLGWGERAPSDEDFVAVMRDLVYQELDQPMAARWRELSEEEKAKLLLKVGP